MQTMNLGNGGNYSSLFAWKYNYFKRLVQNERRLYEMYFLCTEP